MTEPVDVLWTGENAPGYAHPGDAGADLVSTEAFTLQPGERHLTGTGLRIVLPEGYAAFVVPRSGLAAKHGITIVNAPGTVDAGYRGEVKVALLNTDATEAYDVAVGDRIAQMIVMPVPQVRFSRVEQLPESVRGQGGFGSSGYGAAQVSDGGPGEAAGVAASASASARAVASDEDTAPVDATASDEDTAPDGAARTAEEGTRA